MVLSFSGSSNPTIGVEIEMQILDAQTFELAGKSDELVKACISSGLERVKQEVHKSMVEVDSEVSKDVKECRSFIAPRIEKLDHVARGLGLELSVLGSHPLQHWSTQAITEYDRYQNLHEKHQWLIRRMNVCGLHVHVGVESGSQALAISNALIRYLPHLLALSANSPFWHGLDTGMQSSRANIMDSFPFSGIPHKFNSWKEFEHYYETLFNAGAIDSMKDLYWFIRPNLVYGTIELRICDAPLTLDETMAIVALIQCLVVYIGDSIEDKKWFWSKEELWLSLDNHRRAARYGLNADLAMPNGKTKKISDTILELVEMLAPTADKLNCLEELEGIKKIIIHGNGAERQLLTFHETQSFKEVINLGSSFVKEYQI